MKTPIHPGRVQDNYAQAMCSREVILGPNHTLSHCPMLKNGVKLSVTVRLRVSGKLGGVKTGHALALRGTSHHSQILHRRMVQVMQILNLCLRLNHRQAAPVLLCR